MNSNYKRLGDLIKPISIKNTDLISKDLRGVSYQKFFMPSVAKTVGVDLSTYKLVNKGQFACNLMHVGRDECLPIALHNENTPIIVSPAYFCFEVNDEKEILPKYLFLWFKRNEFDRNACFYTDADVRQGLIKSALLDMLIPVPTIEEQRKIVSEYQAVERRIENNRRLIAKLEETAQTIYRHMFVDNIDPGYLPKGWRIGILKDICNINMGQSPEGETYNDKGDGIIFYQGRTDFGTRYPSIRMFTTDPKKYAKKGDTLLSVRAPVGDINMANNDCSIGRGIASIREINGNTSFTYYLIWSLYDEIAKSNDDGTVFGSINKDNLENLKIFIPPISNIELFENMISKIDKYIFDLCQENDLLSQTLSFLLSKLSKLN